MNRYHYHAGGHKVTVTTYNQPLSFNDSSSSSEEVKKSNKRYRKKAMSPEEKRIHDLHKKFHPIRKEGILADECWRNYYPWKDHPLTLSDNEALSRVKEIAESRLHPSGRLHDYKSGELARQFLYQELLYRIELFDETPWDEQMVIDLKDDGDCVIF
jgi:hypothetical protein